MESIEPTTCAWRVTPASAGELGQIAGAVWCAKKTVLTLHKPTPHRVDRGQPAGDSPLLGRWVRVNGKPVVALHAKPGRPLTLMLSPGRSDVELGF